MRRLALVVASALLGALCPEPAFAAEPPKPWARFVYSRGSGAESCPTGQALRHAVTARLGHDPFVDGAAWIVRCAVTREEGQLRVHIEVIDAHGSIRGERRFASGRTSCADLVAPMVLSLSLATPPPARDAVSGGSGSEARGGGPGGADVSPVARESPAPGPPAPRASPVFVGPLVVPNLPPPLPGSSSSAAVPTGGASGPLPPLIGATGEESAAAADRVLPARSLADLVSGAPAGVSPPDVVEGGGAASSGSGFERKRRVGAAVLGTVGAAPHPSLAMALDAGLRRGRLSGNLEIRADLPRTIAAPPGDVTAWSASVALVPCARWGPFDVCGQARLGLLRVSARGVPEAGASGRAQAYLGARTAWSHRWPGGSAVHLRLEGEGSLLRARVHVAGETLWTTSPYVVALGVGYHYYFP